MKAKSEKSKTPPFEMVNHEGALLARLKEGYDCPQCEGCGHLFTEDERGISSMVDCDCTHLQKRLRLLNDAGIPGKFHGTCFETFHPVNNSQRHALRMAKDFVEDYTPGMQGLLFVGKPGRGKTHLAISILKELILNKGAQCRFVDFFQLLSDIRFGYSQDLSEQAIINPYVKTPVLVIDELAKGRNTDWELSMLDQIISSRYNAADKVTLLTTNYPEKAEPDEEAGSTRGGYVDTSRRKEIAGSESLEDKVGTRIYSRLFEMCRFVPMEGEDYRKLVGAQTVPLHVKKKTG